MEKHMSSKQVRNRIRWMLVFYDTCIFALVFLLLFFAYAGGTKLSTLESMKSVC